MLKEGSGAYKERNEAAYVKRISAVDTFVAGCTAFPARLDWLHTVKMKSVSELAKRGDRPLFEKRCAQLEASARENRNKDIPDQEFEKGLRAAMDEIIEERTRKRQVESIAMRGRYHGLSAIDSFIAQCTGFGTLQNWLNTVKARSIGRLTEEGAQQLFKDKCARLEVAARENRREAIPDHQFDEGLQGAMDEIRTIRHERRPLEKIAMGGR